MGAIATLAVALVACSSSNGGNDSCGQVSPCGGSLVGTWKIVAGCANTSSSTIPANQACPGESVGSESVSASGTVTFNSDGTYAVTSTLGSSVTITVPTSCLTSGSVSISCSDLGSTLGGAIGDAGDTTSCTMSGSACACTVSQPAQTVTEMGTYTTADDSFTATPSSSSTGNTMAGTNGYCVQGNTLHVLAGGADAGTSVDLVATKQ